MIHRKFCTQVSDRIDIKSDRPAFINGVKSVPDLNKNCWIPPSIACVQKRTKCTQDHLSNEPVEGKNASPRENISSWFGNRICLLALFALVMPGCVAQRSVGLEKNSPLLTSVQKGTSARQQIPAFEMIDPVENAEPTSETENDFMAVTPKKSVEEKCSPFPDLMNVIDARLLGVTSITANLKVKLLTATGTHDLNGILYADNRDNVRIQFFGIFRILALDVALQKEMMTCFLPTKKCVLRGSKKDVIQNGPTELALIAHVANIQDLFFPRAWVPNALERRGVIKNPEKITVNVLGGDEDAPERLRKFNIHIPTAQILSQDVFFENKNIAHIEYTPAQHLTPQSVKLTDTQSGSILSFEIQSIELNTPIEEAQFSLKIPASIRIQTPREFTVDSKCLMSGGKAVNPPLSK
jgi:hypothetical protein